MMPTTPPEKATLLDVLIDGFEKNEVLGGCHWRVLPLADEPAAHSKFAEFSEEARRWKGAPARESLAGPRRVAAWADLELRQLGRGVMVLVKAPWFSGWWNERSLWAGGPLDPLYDWLAETP